jgi:hypothetical protein
LVLQFPFIPTHLIPHCARNDKTTWRAAIATCDSYDQPLGGSHKLPVLVLRVIIVGQDPSRM